MGLIIGLLKRIFKLFIYIAIFIAVVLVIPNLPPYTKFTEIKIEQTQPRTGVLSHNEALNNAQKLFTGKILGPEAFRLFNGELYTGVATGEVVKISPGGHITFVTKIGQPCTGLPQEHICGRPLGLDIDEKNKLLYVADSYHGIWKVDLKTDKKQLLVSPNVAIDGKPVKLFNGIALDKNGNLYWTHSSSDFDLKDGAVTCLSDPSGRLLYYNSARNKSEVLLSDLWFANGVVISPDNQFVLVAESSKYQIIKYFINGPKKGKSEVFISGLPGIPDNIRVLPDGSGVLAALYVVFDDEHPLISRSLASTPMARKFLARLNRMIEIPFEFLNEHYPHVIFEEILYKIGHFSSLSSIMPPMSGFLQIDWNGNVVASYYNTDKSYGTSSDAIVYNDKLYIGSPHSPFIASVSVPPLLKKAFATSEYKSSSATKQEGKREPQPKADTTTTRKPVVEEEIKVVKIKDLHQADKPPVQNIQAPNTAHEKIESNEKKNPESSRDNKINAEKSERVKSEADAKLKPIEPKPVKKEADTKPKPVEEKPTKKEAETKPKPVETKPVLKEAETKPKPVETKPVKKEPETKSKPVETKPVIKEAETKSKPVETKPVKKEPETKSKPVGTKPVIKEAETKSKPVETKPVKKEPETKSKPVETKPIKKETETKYKPVETKPETKPNPVETKPVKKEPETKSKPVETKPIKKETETKYKPVETKPVKKEAETKPKPVATKPVIKEPETKPKPAETKPIKKETEVKPKPVEEKLKKETEAVNSRESIKKSDKKLNVDSEPVKVDYSTEKPKVQKGKDINEESSKNKPSNEQKQIPDQIPVTEEIPSDSIKPSKETLKVITKSGPVEIPNPN